VKKKIQKFIGESDMNLNDKGGEFQCVCVAENLS